MPTLLGLLNYNKPYFAFGRDLNRDSTLQPFVINYGTNQFQLIQGDTLLVRDNKSLVAAYYYKTDSLLLNNLLAPAGGGSPAGSTQVSTAVGTAGNSSAAGVAAGSTAVSSAAAGAAAGRSTAVSSASAGAAAVSKAGSASAGSSASAGVPAGANTDSDYAIIYNAPQIQDKELLAKQNAFFKAIIQQYVNRMIDNRLTPAN